VRKTIGKAIPIPRNTDQRNMLDKKSDVLYVIYMKENPSYQGIPKKSQGSGRKPEAKEYHPFPRKA